MSAISDLGLPVDGAPQANPALQRLRPLQVTWEMTRECDWKPVTARRAGRGPQERPQVSTAEAFHLIEEIAKLDVPLFALSGGDALLRPDLLPLLNSPPRIRCARR
jgi:MoaA/NifB/PqqE/SkfB family radical SAM enzyme